MRTSGQFNQLLPKGNYTKSEATFEFINSDVSTVEKEVLLYDLFDVIGTIGGSLGVTVGISIFAIISCCIDEFLELFE